MTAADETHFVWAHPGYQFGALCVYPTRIPVDALAGSVWAGDPVQFVAEGYGIERVDVILACWFVARYPEPGWQRKASRAWESWSRFRVLSEVVDPPQGET